jgi:hypothetical protein
MMLKMLIRLSQFVENLFVMNVAIAALAKVDRY